MHWLDPVNSLIESRAAEVQPALLARTADRLSDFYREGQLSRTSLESDPLFPLAYAVTRLPATAAAIEFVFEKIRERVPDFSPTSLLDLGAGPATSLLPLLLHFASVTRASFVEPHTRLAALGQLLAGGLTGARNLTADWKKDRLPLSSPPQPHDLVLLSYVLNELDSAARSTTLLQAWSAARELILLIEPGTPAGFASILAARDQLISLGARVLAPCPHECACPLAANATEKWCHFSVRLPRTRRHRLAKHAELGWEDEKFSYCVLARPESVPSPRPACIISRPTTMKPGIELPLCAPDGLERRLIRKSDPAMPRARRAKWGDFW